MNKPSAASSFPPVRGEQLTLATLNLDADSVRRVRELAGRDGAVRLVQEIRLELGRSWGGTVAWESAAPPELCLLDFDEAPEEASRAAALLKEHYPGMALFAVSAQARPEAILQAMRSGCGEYLGKPLQGEEFLQAVRRVRGRRERRLGRLRVLTAGKGGVGVTALAAHLGVTLARRHRRKVLLVDLHAGFGDAALYLGLAGQRYHLFELAERPERLDRALVESYVRPHASGLHLLAAPEGGQAPRPVESEALLRTLDFLRTLYEEVLADAPAEMALGALAASCDEVYIVTTPELAALRNTARLLGQFEQSEVLARQLRLVLNRQRKEAHFNPEQIEKALKSKLFASIPNQYEQMSHALEEGLGGDGAGRALGGWLGRNGSELARGVERLAAALLEEPVARAGERRSG